MFKGLERTLIVIIGQKLRAFSKKNLYFYTLVSHIMSGYWVPNSPPG